MSIDYTKLEKFFENTIRTAEQLQQQKVQNLVNGQQVKTPTQPLVVSDDMSLCLEIDIKIDHTKKYGPSFLDCFELLKYRQPLGTGRFKPIRPNTEAKQNKEVYIPYKLLVTSGEIVETENRQCFRKAGMKPSKIQGVKVCPRIDYVKYQELVSYLDSLTLRLVRCGSAYHIATSSTPFHCEYSGPLPVAHGGKGKAYTGGERKDRPKRDNSKYKMPKNQNKPKPQTQPSARINDNIEEVTRAALNETNYSMPEEEVKDFHGQKIQAKEQKRNDDTGKRNQNYDYQNIEYQIKMITEEVEYSKVHSLTTRLEKFNTDNLGVWVATKLDLMGAVHESVMNAYGYCNNHNKASQVNVGDLGYGEQRKDRFHRVFLTHAIRTLTGTPNKRVNMLALDAIYERNDVQTMARSYCAALSVNIVICYVIGRQQHQWTSIKSYAPTGKPAGQIWIKYDLSTSQTMLLQSRDKVHTDVILKKTKEQPQIDCSIDYNDDDQPVYVTSVNVRENKAPDFKLGVYNGFRDGNVNYEITLGKEYELYVDHSNKFRLCQEGSEEWIVPRAYLTIPCVTNDTLLTTPFQAKLIDRTLKERKGYVSLVNQVIDQSVYQQLEDKQIMKELFALDIPTNSPAEQTIKLVEKQLKTLTMALPPKPQANQAKVNNPARHKPKETSNGTKPNAIATVEEEIKEDQPVQQNQPITKTILQDKVKQEQVQGTQRQSQLVTPKEEREKVPVHQRYQNTQEQRKDEVGLDGESIMNITSQSNQLYVPTLWDQYCRVAIGELGSEASEAAAEKIDIQEITLPPKYQMPLALIQQTLGEFIYSYIHCRTHDQVAGKIVGMLIAAEHIETLTLRFQDDIDENIDKCLELLKIDNQNDIRLTNIINQLQDARRLKDLLTGELKPVKPATPIAIKDTSVFDVKKVILATPDMDQIKMLAEQISSGQKNYSSIYYELAPLIGTRSLNRIVVALYNTISITPEGLASVINDIISMDITDSYDMQVKAQYNMVKDIVEANFGAQEKPLEILFEGNKWQVASQYMQCLRHAVPIKPAEHMHLADEQDIIRKIKAILPAYNPEDHKRGLDEKDWASMLNMPGLIIQDYQVRMVSKRQYATDQNIRCLEQAQRDQEEAESKVCDRLEQRRMEEEKEIDNQFNLLFAGNSQHRDTVEEELPAELAPITLAPDDPINSSPLIQTHAGVQHTPDGRNSKNDITPREDKQVTTGQSVEQTQPLANLKSHRPDEQKFTQGVKVAFEPDESVRHSQMSQTGRSDNDRDQQDVIKQLQQRIIELETNRIQVIHPRGKAKSEENRVDSANDSQQLSYDRFYSHQLLESREDNDIIKPLVNLQKLRGRKQTTLEHVKDKVKHNDHGQLTVARQVTLFNIYKTIEETSPDVIVYIGGMIKREVPIPNKMTVYINPDVQSNDMVNNDLIIEEIKTNQFVRLYRSTIQNLPVEHFREKHVGKKLFVTINSSYYFKVKHIARLCNPGDIIIAVGHHGSQGATTSNYPGLLQSCKGVHITQHQIRMSMLGTSDHYNHTTSELINYDKWVSQDVTITKSQRINSTRCAGLHYSQYVVRESQKCDKPILSQPEATNDLSTVNRYNLADVTDVRQVVIQSTYLQDHILHSAPHTVISSSSIASAVGATSFQGTVGIQERLSFADCQLHYLSSEMKKAYQYEIPQAYIPDRTDGIAFGYRRFERGDMVLTMSYGAFGKCKLIQNKCRCWFSCKGDCKATQSQYLSLYNALDYTDEKTLAPTVLLWMLREPEARNMITMNNKLKQAIQYIKQTTIAFRVQSCKDISHSMGQDQSEEKYYQQQGICSVQISSYPNIEAEKRGHKQIHYSFDIQDYIQFNKLKIDYYVCNMSRSDQNWLNDRGRGHDVFVLENITLDEHRHQEANFIQNNKYFIARRHRATPDLDTAVPPNETYSSTMIAGHYHNTQEVLKCDLQKLITEGEATVISIKNDKPVFSHINPLAYQFVVVDLDAMAIRDWQILKQQKDLLERFNIAAKAHRDIMQYGWLSSEDFNNREYNKYYFEWLFNYDQIQPRKNPCPITERKEIAGYHCIVTNQLESALRYIQDMQRDRTCAFDVERTMDGKTASYQLAQGMTALMYYGPDAEYYRPLISALIRSKVYEPYVWDECMEKQYTDCYDLQQHPSVTTERGAKIALSKVSSLLCQLPKQKKTKMNWNDFAKYQVSDKYQTYALTDVITLMQLANAINMGARMPHDYNYVKIGNYKLFYNNLQEIPSGDRQWCQLGRNEVNSPKQVEASIYSNYKYEVKFQDVGSGASQKSCGAACILTYLRLSQGQQFQYNKDNDPVEQLQLEFNYNTIGLRPGPAGISTNALRQNLKINNINYIIAVTDTQSPVLPDHSHIDPNNKSRPLIILAHNNHAWLGMYQDWYQHKLLEPKPCPCGACVQKPGNVQGDLYANSLAAKSALNKLLKRQHIDDRHVAHIDHLRIEFNNTYHKIHYEAIPHKEPRESRIISTDKGYVLTSRCPGKAKIVDSASQQIISFKSEICNDTTSNAKAIGPIINTYTETWCKCSHSLAYAAVQRTAKSKEIANFNQSDINDLMACQWQSESQTLPVYDSIWQTSYDMLMKSNKTTGQKKMITQKLQYLYHDANVVQTYTEPFVKREVLPSKGWPRLISAREPGLRQLTAPIISQIQEELYKNPHFIKKQNEEQIIPTVVNRLKGYKHVACLDIGSYDAAQKGLIWQLEENRIKKSPYAQLWRAIAHNANYIKSRKFQMKTQCTRNSGEQTTSMTNTDLNDTIIRYAVRKAGLVEGVNCDWFVEGDDMIIGFNDERFLDLLIQAYEKFGFKITVEHMGTINGAIFCKIKFLDINGDIIAFRRIDHALIKLGWTVKNVTQQSQMAKALIRAKCLSFKSLYKHSKLLNQLADVIIEKYGASRMRQSTKRHIDEMMAAEYNDTMSAIMSETDFIDIEYGPEIIQMIQEVNDGTQIIQPEKYPRIFGSLHAGDKYMNYKFPDYGYARSFEHTQEIGWQTNQPPNHSIRMTDFTRLDKELETFDSLAKFQESDYFDVIDIGEMKVPVYIMGSLSEKPELLTRLQKFAVKGVLLHVPSALYAQLKSDYGPREPKEWIRPLTAHNDKLGFDWDVVTKKFKVSAESKQFAVSGYKKLVADARDFHSKIANTKYSEYLDKMTKTFTSEIIINPGRRMIEQSAMGKYTNSGERKVGSLVQDIHKLLTEHQNEQQEQEFLQLQDNSISVDPYKLVGALRNVGDIMANIAEDYQDQDDRLYIAALVDPFDPSTSGARVPQMHPEETVCLTDYQSSNFTISTTGRCLLVINFEAIRQSPYIIIPDVINDFTSSQTGSIQVNYEDRNLTVPTGAYNTGMTWAQLIAARKLGRSVNNLEVTNGLRLVGASIRLNKTSVRENESGVLSVAYCPRGLQVNTTLKQAVDDPAGKYFKKVYLAKSDESKCRGRQGTLFQANFRPREQAELDSFVDAKSAVFLSDRPGFDFEGLIDTDAETFNEDYRNNYMGPVCMYGRADNTATVYNLVTDTSILQANADTDMSISARSLQRRHTVVCIIEGAENGTQFELEIIRRFEGPPSEFGQQFERRSNVLDNSSNSPFDLMRKMNYVQEQLTRYDVGVSGMFDLNPVMVKEDFTRCGLDKEYQVAGIKDYFRKASKWIVSSIIKSIPVLAPFHDPLMDLINKVVGSNQLMIIDRIITESKAIQPYNHNSLAEAIDKLNTLNQLLADNTISSDANEFRKINRKRRY